MQKKIKTNEEALRAFFKDLDMFEAAIVRERIVKISEMTREAIQKKPTSFDNPIFDHSYYICVCDKIDQHLHFEEDKPKKEDTPKPQAELFKEQANDLEEEINTAIQKSFYRLGEKIGKGRIGLNSRESVSLNVSSWRDVTEIGWHYNRVALTITDEDNQHFIKPITDEDITLWTKIEVLKIIEDRLFAEDYVLYFYDKDKGKPTILKRMTMTAEHAAELNTEYKDSKNGHHWIPAEQYDEDENA